MLAHFLHRINESEKPLLIHTVRRVDALDDGCARSDGACLIQNHGIYPSARLKGAGGLKQYSPSRSHSVSDHYGHGGCKTQGAGTAYHHHCHGAHRGLGHRGRGYKPAEEGKQGYAQNAGYKYTRNPVGQTSDRSLGCRGIAHHADYLGYHGIPSHLNGATGHIAGLVYGSAEYLHSLAHVPRYALTGKHRLIHRTLSAKHLPIGGHP